MVVKNKNSITFLLFVSLSLVLNTGCASEVQSKQILDRAELNYKKSLAAFEMRGSYCDKKAQEKEIKRSLFDGIKLTEKQLKITLYLHYRKAIANCDGETYGNFLKQRGIYNATLKHFKVTPNEDDPSYYDDNDLFGGKHESIKIELLYLDIPQKERDKIENLIELKTPFKRDLLIK